MQQSIGASYCSFEEDKVFPSVQAIIEDIELIMANGKAYQSEGDVFFDVAAMQDYGCLSGRKQV